MNKYLAEIMDCKANEYGYSADVFLSKDHIKYTVDENSVFNMITFGTSTVISGSQTIIDQIKKELDGIESIELFDAPSLYLIDSILHDNNHKLSEICDFFIPSENIAEHVKKRDCPFPVKKIDKEDISKIDDIEIYDNALCQGEASSLNEMAYIALDSGNNYLLQNFTNRPMKDQIGSFIKLTGISVDQHQMISVELINQPGCWIDYERGASNN